MTEQQVKKLSPYHRDAFEIWGNQWSPVKVMPGTCMACVWGDGEHVAGCPREFSDFAYPGGEPI